MEKMLMPSSAVPEYEKNLDACLNEAPEKVHEITRRLMKKHLLR